MIKIKLCQLKYGQVDEMQFEASKSYLIYGENQEFKQEIKAYFINSLIHDQKKIFIVSSKSVLTDENTLLDNMMYLSDCSREEVVALCKKNHFDQKLLNCKMHELTYEQKIWMQLLCALMMNVQVILLDHLFKQNDLTYQEVKAVIYANNRDICIINFSESRHSGEQFDEIWQVKDKRCLFIK